MENKIEALIKELFEKMNINIDWINIEKSQNNILNIKIKTKESWIIIWPQWKNLDSIQNIIKLMSSKVLWEKIKIHLEINDYSKTKDDRLFDFINNEISHLQKTWVTIKLPFYSSYERKKIHWYISKMKDKWIYTKSSWEWKERRLFIYKEKPKLTIDIDWDDI